MRFTTAPEQRDFARSLRDLLTASDGASVARAWAGGDTAPGRKLWARLAEVGVTSLLGPGSGAGPVELVLALEEIGRAAVPGPYVEAAVLAALLPDADPETMSTLAAPPQVPYALDAAVADAVYLLDGTALCSAAVDAEVSSVDRTRRLASVRAGEVVRREVDAPLARRLGALTTAAQLHGAGQAVLERAVAYAGQRTQFGSPIGRFQAVKHLLADAHVGLELARPLLFGAALTMSPRDVSAAKVACTDAAYRASRTALQVHGAIGYTAEYDLSLWLTKIRALVTAWGTPRQHRDTVRAALR